MKNCVFTLLAGFTLVLFSGCGGEADSGSGNSDSKTGEGQSGNQSAAQQSSGDKASGRVRVDGIFSAGSDLEDKNKLKHLAIGVHNFHDVYRKFPMAVAGDKKFSDQLSWRIRLLPYVELLQEFEQFDKAQPWDSAKNKPLMDGKGREAFTLSNGNLVCAIRHEKQAQSMRDIMDGTSNTIMLMENPQAGGDDWTKPKDLTEKEAVKIIKSLKKGEFLLGVFYDASTCKIYSTEGKDIQDKDIEAIFGYKDAMLLNDMIFRPGK